MTDDETQSREAQCHEQQSKVLMAIKRSQMYAWAIVDELTIH
jgi:hypothetical protein